ncbi:MAG: hypothetical protein ACQXXH_02045 [Candidatus Bathyarchaeia archaeon]|jgi:hypothetical protein|nr:hypothetical protein [Candidatus Bathyarchaeota archaeon A05DMB-4]MDH7594526.1 hypothetical protein [Candidatus Bathyarchaeota archaeon]
MRKIPLRKRILHLLGIKSAFKPLPSVSDERGSPDGTSADYYNREIIESASLRGEQKRARAILERQKRSPAY